MCFKHQSSCEKASTLKARNLLPVAFRVDAFSESKQKLFDRNFPFENISIPLKEKS